MKFISVCCNFAAKPESFISIIFFHFFTSKFHLSIVIFVRDCESVHASLVTLYE